MHIQANMGSCELAVMGMESKAISAWVTKLIVTIFSKKCNIHSLMVKPTLNGHSKIDFLKQRS